MKKQFVTYEIALKLKELGFDEICINTYQSTGHLVFEYGSFFHPESNSDMNCTALIAAPLWQQVIDWFREKHNIFIELDMWLGNKNKPMFSIGGYIIIDNERENIGDSEISDSYKTYDEAREKAILKAIELCQK